jgi:geranylgeranyl diphosphate synthase type II
MHQALTLNKDCLTYVLEVMSPAATVHRLETPYEDLLERVEKALAEHLASDVGADAPPRLREAIHHAVFGGGARLRPTLCLAVAASCGEGDPRAPEAAAVALEFIHCASLVHDDLPCFDDAPVRRGKPTVHAAFGVSTAVLAGDALIVLAFSALARPDCAGMVTLLAQATGPARGIIAGQAWESESAPSLDEYHRAKTAALFEAAAIFGARSAGADARDWRTFGEWVGRAYQAADDVLDAMGGGEAGTEKTMGRDEALGRPSVVRAYGLSAARRRVTRCLERATESLPATRNGAPIGAWLDRFAARLESFAAPQ